MICAESVSSVFRKYIARINGKGRQQFIFVFIYCHAYTAAAHKINLYGIFIAGIYRAGIRLIGNFKYMIEFTHYSTPKPLKVLCKLFIVSHFLLYVFSQKCIGFL